MDVNIYVSILLGVGVKRGVGVKIEGDRILG
jgi:hypothetical protein